MRTGVHKMREGRQGQGEGQEGGKAFTDPFVIPLPITCAAVHLLPSKIQVEITTTQHLPHATHTPPPLNPALRTRAPSRVKVNPRLARAVVAVRVAVHVQPQRPRSRRLPERLQQRGAQVGLQPLQAHRVVQKAHRHARYNGAPKPGRGCREAGAIQPGAGAGKLAPSNQHGSWRPPTKCRCRQAGAPQPGRGRREADDPHAEACSLLSAGGTHYQRGWEWLRKAKSTAGTGSGAAR
eukprot:358375-Chlamydomonas_euryale.AAC.9